MNNKHILDIVVHCSIKNFSWNIHITTHGKGTLGFFVLFVCSFWLELFCSVMYSFIHSQQNGERIGDRDSCYVESLVAQVFLHSILVIGVQNRQLKGKYTLAISTFSRTFLRKNGIHKICARSLGF